MSRRSEYYLGGRKKYYPVGSDCIVYHAYWDGTAKDHSIYGHNGTVVGATFVENGLDFDGTDDVVTLDHTDTDLWDQTSDFTYVLWFQTSSAAIVRFCTNYNNEVGSDGYPIYHDPYLNNGSLVFHIYRADGYYYSSVNQVSGYNDGAWRCIVFSCDRDVGLDIYMNNSQVQTDRGPTNTNSLDYRSAVSISAASGNFPFDGIIGEFLHYKGTAWDSTKVTDYYNATKARYGL